MGSPGRLVLPGRWQRTPHRHWHQVAPLGGAKCYEIASTSDVASIAGKMQNRQDAAGYDGPLMAVSSPADVFESQVRNALQPSSLQGRVRAPLPPISRQTSRPRPGRGVIFIALDSSLQSPYSCGRPGEGRWAGRCGVQVGRRAQILGMAKPFYGVRVDQHLQVGMPAVELLRQERAGRLHSRTLRCFADVASQRGAPSILNGRPPGGRPRPTRCRPSTKPGPCCRCRR